MQSAKILKSKIADPAQITTGIIVTYHCWPGIVEMSMRAGFDYIIIDLEHLPHSAEMVAEACAIGRRNDFPVLIRPSDAEFTPLRIAMDLGPCGLLVPYVQEQQDLETIEEAVYLKPRGRRRPGGLGNYWISDFNYETWKSEVEDDLIILPQIESVKGLQNIDIIANHPLTTAMAIGPYDLSADLGCCFDPAAPQLLSAIDTIRASAAKAGKTTWMIGEGTDAVKNGFHFVCLAEPMMFLEKKLQELNHLTKTGRQALE